MQTRGTPGICSTFVFIILFVVCAFGDDQQQQANAHNPLHDSKHVRDKE